MHSHRRYIRTNCSTFCFSFDRLFSLGHLISNVRIVRSYAQNVTDAKSENDNLHFPIIIKVDAFKTINMRISVVGIRKIDNSVGHFELRKKKFFLIRGIYTYFRNCKPIDRSISVDQLGLDKGYIRQYQGLLIPIGDTMRVDSSNGVTSIGNRTGAKIFGWSPGGVRG